MANPGEKLTIVHMDELMLKKNLLLYQAAAKGLTEAGFGPFSFTVSKQQIIPGEGFVLPEDSHLVVVNYDGPENRDRLSKVTDEAGNILRQMQSRGKSWEEIRLVVQPLVTDLIQLGPEREERERKFRLAQTLAEHGYNIRIYAIAAGKWLGHECLESGLRIGNQAEVVHHEVGDSIRRETEILHRYYV